MQKVQPYEAILLVNRGVDEAVRGLERLKRADLAGIPMTFAGPGKRDDELDAGITAGARKKPALTGAQT